LFELGFEHLSAGFKQRKFFKIDLVNMYIFDKQQFFLCKNIINVKNQPVKTALHRATKFLSS